MINDSKKYFDKLVEYVDERKTTYISNEYIIKYIIKERKDYLFPYCDYNSINYTDDEIKKAINIISKEYNRYYIRNQQLVDYILDHNLTFLYHTIEHNSCHFNNKHLAKYIDYLKNDLPNIEIKNQSLVNYIIDNEVKKLYSNINFNKCIFNKEQMPKVIKALNEISIIDDYKLEGKIDNMDIIRYIIENNNEFLYYTINIDNVRFPEDLIPKIIEYYKELKVDFDKIVIFNPEIIDYIIMNDVEELYGDISISEENNLDFNKEILHKLLKIDKVNPRVRARFPIINYLYQKSPTEVDRFFELIKIRELSINDLKNINESFQQAIFRQDNSKIVNIFSKIKRIADNKIIANTVKKNLINQWVELFIEEDCIPEYLIKDLYNKNKDISIIEKKKLFLYEVLNKVVIDNDFKPYLDILHEITDSYIASKANKYYIKHNVDNALDTIEYNYDIKENRREVIRKIFNYLNKSNHNLLMRILKENGYMYDKIEGNQFKNARKIFLDWLDRTVANEGNISILPRELQYLFKDNLFVDNLKKEIHYQKRETKLNDMNEIFVEKELDAIFKVINDDIKYQKLIEILNNYKFLEWPSVFNKQIKQLYGEEFYNLYSFITNFSSIFDKNNEKYISSFIQSDEYKELYNNMRKKNKNEGLKISDQELDEIIKKEIISTIEGKFTMKPHIILNDYNTYASYNLIYKLILGTEDYSLIKENPKRNSAMKDENETLPSFTKNRLEKAIQCYLEMLNLQEVTTPSFSKTITLSNGKKIKVIVGNRTSPRNLTLGERTESCMRIRGIGKDLFDFCNMDPRGLHIIFEDPNTGELISRISGFRNGNTLFLNQLRHSLLMEYDDKNLIEAIKEVSNDIIKESQDTEKDGIPIDNVIADCEFVLAQLKSIKCPFKYRQVTIPKYSDIGKDNIVVLASVKGNDELSPIVTDEFGQHIYKPVRQQPKIIDTYNKETSDYIKKMEIIKECQYSKDLELFKHIEFERDDINYKNAIIADDWVVYLDNNNEIIIINASSDERAKEEINKAINYLNETSESTFKKGGKNHGKNNA